MADPVNEAVARALAYGTELVKSGQTVDFAPRNILPWAAREALAPIRELHQWTTDGDADLCSHGCTDHEGYLVWPCDTARLVYTTEELSDGE